MNFHQSLKFQFYVQKIFGMSVLNLKDFRADKRSLIISVIYILTAAVLFLITLVRMIPGIILVFANNPIDQSSYSTTIGQAPLGCCIIITFAMWISVNRNHEMETQFYQKILDIDDNLLKHCNLQKMYKKFRCQTRITLFPFLLEIPIALFSALSYSLDGLFVFAKVMIIFDIAILFNSMYVNIFFLNVKLIRDRLKQVQMLCDSCDEIEKFRDITRIYKSLNELVQVITKMSGPITGVIFVNNFFSIACYWYMMAISLMLWFKQRSDTLYNISTIMVPNIWMMYEGFCAGQWLINDVSPVTVFY